VDQLRPTGCPTACRGATRGLSSHSPPEYNQACRSQPLTTVCVFRACSSREGQPVWLRPDPADKGADPGGGRTPDGPSTSRHAACRNRTGVHRPGAYTLTRFTLRTLTDLQRRHCCLATRLHSWPAFFAVLSPYFSLASLFERLFGQGEEGDANPISPGCTPCCTRSMSIITEMAILCMAAKWGQNALLCMPSRTQGVLFVLVLTMLRL
jgi:hypothetical protein